MIVVFDASSLVSAALKADSVPERALIPAITEPDRLILSREVECRDPKDDKYLELGSAGRADVIASSDARHLLSMRPWRGIWILSPAVAAWLDRQRADTLYLTTVKPCGTAAGRGVQVPAGGPDQRGHRRIR